MNLKSTLSILLCCMFSISSFSQTVLKGNIDSEDGGVIGAAVLLFKDNVQVKGTATDFDGNYIFTNLDPGIYKLDVSSLGHKLQQIEEVVIIPIHSENIVDIFLEIETMMLGCIFIVEYSFDCFATCTVRTGCQRCSHTTEVETEKKQGKLEETTEENTFQITTSPNPCAAGDLMSISANDAFDELRLYNLTGSLVGHRHTEITRNLHIKTPRSAGVYALQLLKDGIPFDGSQQIILVE